MTEKPLPAYPENIVTDYVSKRHLDRYQRRERERAYTERQKWASFLRYLDSTASAYGPVDLSTGIGDDLERDQVEP